MSSVISKAKNIEAISNHSSNFQRVKFEFLPKKFCDLNNQ